MGKDTTDTEDRKWHKEQSLPHSSTLAPRSKHMEAVHAYIE